MEGSVMLCHPAMLPAAAVMANSLPARQTHVSGRPEMLKTGDKGDYLASAQRQLPLCWRRQAHNQKGSCTSGTAHRMYQSESRRCRRHYRHGGCAASGAAHGGLHVDRTELAPGLQPVEVGHSGTLSRQENWQRDVVERHREHHKW